MKDYSLYEIVRKLNGGSILPVGETNYDDNAYKRMLEQESLISELINDIEHVVGQDGYGLHSVYRAKTQAIDWLREMRDDIDDVLEEVKE